MAAASSPAQDEELMTQSAYTDDWLCGRVH